jgi:hypothetical protein
VTRRLIAVLLLALVSSGCTNIVGQTVGYLACLAAGTVINTASGAPLASAQKCLESSNTPQQEPQAVGGPAATCGACLEGSCKAPSDACVGERVCLCLAYCIGGRNSEAACEAACNAAPNDATRAELGCIADNCAADCPGFAP